MSHNNCRKATPVSLSFTTDDTITSAPRPPTDLTIETEPRIESPNTSQLLNSNCTHNAANQFDNSDYTPSLQETRRPKLRQQFILCANRTLLANSHNHLCQHDTTSLSRGVETRPHPTESHDQLDSDVGLVWLERPLHLVLKGLFLLRTLRVSAGTHAADRGHFTERTNSSSTERSSDMNTMLSLSSLPAKRHKMYRVGVSCMCNSRW